MNNVVTISLTPEEFSTIKSLVRNKWKTLSVSSYWFGSAEELEMTKNKLLLLIGKLDNVVVPAKKL